MYEIIHARKALKEPLGPWEGKYQCIMNKASGDAVTGGQRSQELILVLSPMPLSYKHKRKMIKKTGQCISLFRNVRRYCPKTDGICKLHPVCLQSLAE